jgi:hypothetical protein
VTDQYDYKVVLARQELAESSGVQEVRVCAIMSIRDCDNELTTGSHAGGEDDNGYCE